MKITELLKKTFELWVQQRWLNIINKQINKFVKLADKSQRQKIIVHELLHAYNTKYGKHFDEDRWK